MNLITGGRHAYKALSIVLALVLVGVAVTVPACSTFQPGPICRVAESVCYYSHELCQLLADTTSTRRQVDSVSQCLADAQEQFKSSLVAVRAAKRK